MWRAPNSTANSVNTIQNTKATAGGVDQAASCNDCHSSGGTAHRILPPGHVESTINFFNISQTCGKCHDGIEQEYWEGIHGVLAARGETDTPVCTHCHGEHGIISPEDPRSQAAVPSTRASTRKIATFTAGPARATRISCPGFSGIFSSRARPPIGRSVTSGVRMP